MEMIGLSTGRFLHLSVTSIKVGLAKFSSDRTRSGTFLETFSIFDTNIN